MTSTTQPPPQAVDASADDLAEDRRLVERMLAGDERAMEHFADEFFPRLYRFALSRLRGNSDLARDLVQTTVCKALEKLQTYRGEAPLFGWLCGCCRNEIAMHFRSARSRPQAVELIEETAEASEWPVAAAWGAPHATLERKEEARRVHASLDELPRHYAQALEWKYLDHLPVVEIARRLDLGPKAAESILTRARTAFRKRYQSLARATALGNLSEHGPPRPAVGGMEP